jgi:curli biogenesis system outer membrane secretion channel CsgG
VTLQRLPLALALALAASVPALAQSSEARPPVEAPGPTPPPAPTPPAPPAPKKATLAVLPFTFTKAVHDRRHGETDLVLKEFQTSLLTAKFITALVATRKFDVVERARVDELIDEIRRGDAGLQDPARAIKAGKQLGADYFLMGDISVFSVTATPLKRIPTTSRFTRDVITQVIVDMRIVDARTSKVVAAEKGELHDQVRSMHDRDEGWAPAPGFVDALQRALCEQLVLKTVDGVYPVKVAATTNGVITLNRGQGGGLAPGDLLDVFAAGEEIFDPDTGESLGREEQRLGRLRVTEVLERVSRAVPHQDQGMGAIPVGALCRKVAPEQAPPPAPQRGGPPEWRR